MHSASPLCSMQSSSPDLRHTDRHFQLLADEAHELPSRSVVQLHPMLQSLLVLRHNTRTRRPVDMCVQKHLAGYQTRAWYAHVGLENDVPQPSGVSQTSFRDENDANVYKKRTIPTMVRTRHSTYEAARLDIVSDRRCVSAYLDVTFIFPCSASGGLKLESHVREFFRYFKKRTNNATLPFPILGHPYGGSVFRQSISVPSRCNSSEPQPCLFEEFFWLSRMKQSAPSRPTRALLDNATIDEVASYWTCTSSLSLGNELASGGASGDSPPCDPLRPWSVPTQREPDKSVCTVWYAMESTRKDQRLRTFRRIRTSYAYVTFNGESTMAHCRIGTSQMDACSPHIKPRAFGWYLRKVQTGFVLLLCGLLVATSEGSR